MEKIFVLNYFRGLGATTKIFTRYVITLRNRGFTKGISVFAAFTKVSPLGPVNRPLRCRYRSRAIFAALSCFAFTYIRRL